MAKLANGAGRTVTPQMDADLLLGIMGDDRLVLNVGKKMAAEIIDNNKVRIYDGILVSGGRWIYVEANTYDDFTIETGTQNTIRYDIIGYHLYRDNDEEKCEEFVQKDVGETGSISEESFRNGADEVYISMYKIQIDGITIKEVTPLYTKAGKVYADRLLSLDKVSQVTEEGYLVDALAIAELYGKLSKVSISTQIYDVTLTSNSYVTPYTYYGSFTVSEKEVETYGEPISVTALGNNGAPVPAAFSGAARRSVVLVNTASANVKLYVTFLKLSSYENSIDDTTEETQ